ncbi:MAG: ATPase domain-containing protein [Candidatus Woesearchaeota archaeon]
MIIRRVATGITGLDNLIEGGIPCGASVIVTGTPGSAKSTFGLQFLRSGGAIGENGVYISLEEDPESLVQQADALGMDLRKFIDEKKIHLLKLDINLVQGEDAVKKLMDSEFIAGLNHLQPQRLVLDSLSLAIHLSHNYRLGPRGGTASLMQTFRKLGCTSILIHEREKSEESEIQYGFQDFVADGIIYLQLIRRKEAAEFYRGLTILKMRRTNHGKGVYPFHIEHGGIRVYPDQRVF